MKLNNIKLSILVIAALILSIAFLNSCSSDESPSTSYTFKDQILQGKINSEEWVFKSGYAEDSSFETGKLSINLYAVDNTDPCDTSFYYKSDYKAKIMFSFPKEVVKRDLKFNMSDSTTSQTFTMFTVKDNMNTIVTEGAIELTSISDTEVKGKLVGKHRDDNYYVNGNFTAKFCTKDK